MQQLDRPKKICTFVLGVIEFCLANNLMGGDGFRLTPLGIAQFDQLEASGFRPNLRETKAAISAICPNLSDKDQDILAGFVVNWDELKIAE